jgi:hypothetical protein
MTTVKKIPLAICLIVAQAMSLGLLGDSAHSNNVSRAANSPAYAPPASATDDQIIALIKQSNLGLVMLKRNYLACHPTQLQNGDAPPQLAANGYFTWLKYIADHIKSNTPLGDDYAVIAAGALALTGWTGDCLNSDIKDLQRLALVMGADPAKIGQILFRSFTPYDQSTRDRAASKIAG